MQKIFGVAGEIGSGKGTFVEYAREKFGASTFSFSDVLKSLLDCLYLEKSRENLQDISTILRQRFGEDLLAKVIFEKIKEDKKDKIIAVDSIRRLADIKYLKKIKNFKLIYLEASEKNRFKRVSCRNEKTDDKNKKFSEFKKDSLAETEIQIKSLKKTADFVITNDGTIEEFYKKINKILKK
jgi:dephospho-CoA kinase